MVHLPGVQAVAGLSAGSCSSPPAVLPAPEASSSGSKEQDLVDVLKAKLELSEVVKQEMKTVICAQHAKLEEYKHELARLKGGGAHTERNSRQHALDPEAVVETDGEGRVRSNMPFRLLEEIKRGARRPPPEKGDLEGQVARLKSLVKDLRVRNANLKRVARRYEDMLGQVGASDQNAGTSQPARARMGRSSSDRSISEASGDDALGLPSSGTSSPSLLSPRVRFETSAKDGRASTTTQEAVGRTASSSPRGENGQWAQRRFTRAARDTVALWHEDSPHGLLHQLLYAGSLVVGGSTVALTLFVADPWLRRIMEDRATADSKAGQQMLKTTFYLSGKVTVHGYRRDGVRPEPPRFPDLASLPVQGRGAVLALPLQAGTGQPILAALQVTQQKEGPVGPRSATQEVAGGEKESGGNVLQVQDWQVVALQLLCSTAAGILEMRRQVECAKAMHTRAVGCLDIVGKVHTCSNIVEFEQQVKLLMTSFFNVSSARITFYNPVTRELLLTATRSHRQGRGEPDPWEKPPTVLIGRRNITRISIQDGIVGRCVRKRQVFHLDPILQSPFVRETADGVEISGEKGHINMLAGPMVADLSEADSPIVGVLQLIHKRPRRELDPFVLEQTRNESTDKSPRRQFCEAFTQQDQNLFGMLLHVLGMATYRTMQVQSRGDMEEPTSIRIDSVEKLLGVA